ncbi:MAG TPA: hypothetical protein VFC18_10000 [Burkholderiales bacterium]|nr:hypothetical protein [Burkholderiales bacterium]
MFANVARSRLLPMSVPFRYFGAAAAFQVAAWALLAAFSGEILAFGIGLGPVFAALHLVTLGVLAMSAIGATLQLLPVATRQPVRALWAVKLLWWLLVPGVVLFAWAGATYRPLALGPATMLVVLALLIYSVLLARNLWEARGMKAVVAHGWAALGCLLALAAMGFLLVGRYEHGWAIDHLALRKAHLVLATFGFMGLLAAGLSGFLLPMLALAPPPPKRWTYAVLSLSVVGILLGSFGFLLPGAATGLAAAVLHVAAMERSLRARLRPALGPSFVLVRVSWACLIASLVLAMLDFPGGPLLFGVLLVPGWLLTFLLGVLQRIVPFLGSVHAFTAAGGTPLVSALTPAPLLGLHGALHLAALGGLALGIVTRNALLVHAGTVAGLAASVAFAAFFVFVVVRIRHGIQPPHQPAPA